MALKGLLSSLGQPESYSRKKHYRMGKTLGAGTYGIVREATHDKFGKVAVKIIEKKTVKGHEDMVHDEIKLLETLHHPHIIHLKESFESTTKFYVVTSLATGGELFDRICALGKFTERDAVTLISQVLSAIVYLHDRRIVHRDLKPENLLYLTPEPDSSLVVADFGIAKELQTETETLKAMAGSYGYAAPEILKRTGHSYPADLWSLGVICYTILCGYSPFRADDRDELIAETCRAEIVFHTKYWKDISQEAKDFILGLLNPDPRARKTAHEAQSHMWLTGKTATSSDLLPNVSAGFNARKRFRKAIEMVRLANRLKAMEVSDSEGEEAKESGSKPVLITTQAEADAAEDEAVRRAVSQMHLQHGPRGDDLLAVPGSSGSGSGGSGHHSRKNSITGRRFRSHSEVFAEVVKAKVREAQVEAETVTPAAPDK